MKNIITLFILVLSSTYISAQSEWFGEGSEWIYSYNSFWAGGLVGYELITIDREVQIQGKTCKVLNKKLFESNFMGSSTLVREEEAIVYEENDIVSQFSSNEFFQLFNFNLEVGETSIFSTFQPFNYRVDSIGLMDNTNNRIQYVTLWNPANNFEVGSVEIIEHVGVFAPSFFPNEWNAFIFSDVPFRTLHCYSSNEVNLTIGNLNIDCSDLVSTISNGQNNMDVKIFPNPFKDMIHFDFVGMKPKTIKIVDLTGKEIVTKKSEFQKLLLPNLAHGIYLAIIEFNNGEKIYRKLVKQ